MVLLSEKKVSSWVGFYHFLVSSTIGSAEKKIPKAATSYGIGECPSSRSQRARTHLPKHCLGGPEVIGPVGSVLWFVLSTYDIIAY